MNNSAENLTTYWDISSCEICIIECIILGFSFLFGILLNTYVIWLIITGAGSGVASEFFMLNLSVCGIFSSVYSLLNFLIWFLDDDSMYVLDDLIFGVSTTGQSLFQCLISVERYLAVVYPITFLKYKPLRYRMICCSLVWIITLGYCLVYYFLILSSSEYMWSLSMQFLLFLSIQLFCCVAVLRALKQSGPGDMGREKVEENHMKRRAFNLILLTTVNTIITYAPLTVTALMYIVADCDNYTQWTKCDSDLFLLFWTVSRYCFMLAVFLQPILYLHRFGKISCLSICNILT